MMNFSTLILLGLVILSVWLLHLHKNQVPWAKAALLLCCMAAIVLAVIKTAITSRPKTAGEIMSRYDDYQEICGDVLGTTIADRHPEARVTILVPPPNLSFGYQILKERLQATLEANGLVVTVKALDAPKISAATKAQLLPPGLVMTPEEEEKFLSATMQEVMVLEPVNLKRILADLEDQADLAVFMANYFEPIQDAGLPPKGSGPALVMLNLDITDALPMLQDTVLDIVVSTRTDSDIWTPRAKRPKKKQEAFSKYYEMVTATTQP